MKEEDLMEAPDMSVESLTTVISPLRMCLGGSNEALEDGTMLEMRSIARNANKKAFLYKILRGR
jgi:hypothetical protein